MESDKIITLETNHSVFLRGPLQVFIMIIEVGRQQNVRVNQTPETPVS